MSVIAPWLALAVDWDESEMWDSLPQYGIEEESTMGERLAWVCLMCDAKRKGRGGKVSIRKSVFQKAHRLTGRAVDGMLHRAQKCGAIEINGDFVTLMNWRSYQQKLGGLKGRNSQDSQEIPQSAPTKHPPHITKHTSPPPPPPPPPSTSWAAVEEDLVRYGVAKAGEARGIAEAAGCSVTQVRNLIEHWRTRQPAWGPGALYERLLRFKPDQSFDSLWPPESPDVKREAARQAALESTKKLRAEKATAEIQRAADRAERERREREFGQQLDAMKKPAQKELAERVCPALVHMLPAKGRIESPMLRDWLLAELESVA